MGKCTQGKRPTANGQPFLFSFDSNFEQEAVVPFAFILVPWVLSPCCVAAACDHMHARAPRVDPTKKAPPSLAPTWHHSV